MDAPQLARVADDAAGRECRIRPGAADQGDAPGREQTLQPGYAHERPCGRNSMRREPGPAAGGSAALAALQLCRARCSPAAERARWRPYRPAWCTCSSMTSAVAATPGSPSTPISNAAWMRFDPSPSRRTPTVTVSLWWTSLQVVDMHLDRVERVAAAGAVGCIEADAVHQRIGGVAHYQRVVGVAHVTVVVDPLRQDRGP